jgi:hypothetical protein
MPSTFEIFACRKQKKKSTAAKASLAGASQTGHFRSSVIKPLKIASFSSTFIINKASNVIAIMASNDNYDVSKEMSW